MSGNSKKLIAFNYFGGKFTWLEWLYAYFPNDFIHFVDGFAGSLVVSLNFEGNVIRTANEINGDITNFFYVLRDHPKELIALLELTPCSELEYHNSWQQSTCNIERARRFYVRVRQSFYGLGAQRKNKGFHLAKSKLMAKGGETVSRWNNSLPKLLRVAKEISTNFQITNDDIFNIIKRLDTKRTFFYLDPPYLLETRGSQDDYKYEFGIEDYKRLAMVLNNIKGYAMISGYDHELMNELFESKGWIKIKFPSKKNNIRSKQVTECIWINYPLSKTKSGKQEVLQLEHS
ncbi:DNA adenine methylase [Flavobacterium cerinum]|uniref:DNA adenine methylase n=1 Tax=Flavobacterium cerinum TaxID=2502784 RepID=A0A444HC40_9FLAO|nr:DNA adenine methylase [Flavobacterium cerinum]RWX00937.1 DNA adenine methylase [Flavobacterium cerinum]